MALQNPSPRGVRRERSWSRGDPNRRLTRPSTLENGIKHLGESLRMQQCLSKLFGCIRWSVAYDRATHCISLHTPCIFPLEQHQCALNCIKTLPCHKASSRTIHTACFHLVGKQGTWNQTHAWNYKTIHQAIEVLRIKVMVAEDVKRHTGLRSFATRPDIATVTVMVANEAKHS